MKSRSLPLVIGLLLVLLAPAMAQDAQGLKSGDPETRRLMEEASRHFLERDYKKAAPLYRAALDREKRDRTLSDSLWGVLLDDLGMSYGISGDLKKAKATFEYRL